jgi:virulence factor Mce-like protein
VSRRFSISSSPVLIGSATVLVVIVAVFLAYNANNGLPFVPTYTLTANLRNADALVVGNDVRIAGTRVGSISAITPVQSTTTGRSSAQLTLKLDKSVEPLPIDSTVLVRARSALGLKYLEITKGDSARGYPDGGTIPLRQANPQPVDIDQFFSMFDPKTRSASELNLYTFSAALAGRGTDLNQTIATLPSLLANLTPVMRQLSSSKTGLRELIDALANTAGAVAPVAEAQAGWFRGMDATFSALASVARPYLQESISEGPATLDVATRSFVHQRPFLETSTAFFRSLQPATAALANASGPLGNAIGHGASTLIGAIGLNKRLTGVLNALGAFGQDRGALNGINQLTDTAVAAGPLLNTLAPMQEKCNYPALLLRNLQSALSDGDANGRWFRAAAARPAVGTNNDGGPASQPADGPAIENHLHDTPYPSVGLKGQPCEAGNELYAAGSTVIGHASTLIGTRTESLEGIKKIVVGQSSSPYWRWVTQ